jgi:hypothetical protein
MISYFDDFRLMMLIALGVLPLLLLLRTKREPPMILPSGCNRREPAGFRVGQRPGSVNCGSSAGMMENPARPRISAAHMAATADAEGSSLGGLSQTYGFPMKKTPVGGTGASGGRRSSRGNCDRSCFHSKHQRGPTVHTRLTMIHNFSDRQWIRMPGRSRGSGLRIIARGQIAF